MNLYVIPMYPLPLGQPRGASSKQMKETCLLRLAVHLGQVQDSGQLYIQRSKLYRLTTNIFAEDFLQDLTGFLSKLKMRFLLLVWVLFIFVQSHFLNEILKFQPSPKICSVFCVDEDQFWLKIILMENVQLSLQQGKALVEPCYAKVLA